MVGVAIGDGKINLNQKAVPGNATVFEGNVLETFANSSRVVMPGGNTVELGASSRGVLYRTHLKLEKGASQFESYGPYQVEALSLRIASTSASSARVAVIGSAVRVSALRGGLQVAKANGTLIANLTAGHSLEFSPTGDAEGAAAPSRIQGCVSKTGIHYLLTDQTSNVTFELQGANVASWSGKSIEVLGSVPIDGSPAEGASSVLRVLNAKVISRHCLSTAAAGATGATVAAGAGAATAGGATIAGMSVTTAIIAGVGVAAAGTLIGVAATSGSQQTSPSSH
jgi:hypothetical protein